MSDLYRYAPDMISEQSPEMQAIMRRELREGYAEMAAKAEVKYREAVEAGEEYKAKEWGKDVAYYNRMATEGLIDGPSTMPSKYRYDDGIGVREWERHLRDSLADDEPVVDADEKRVQTLAAKSMLGVLAPSQREVAEIRYVGNVKRTDGAGMQAVKQLTYDTHIRDVNAKWRRLQAVGAVLGGAPEDT